MIYRQITPKIESALRNELVAIIYGARQTGKTTLAKEIASKYKNPLYLTCDDPTVVSNLTQRSVSELKAYIGDADIVIIDEAQRVEKIGIAIKLIHDSYPTIKLLVTGSSSLDLANKVIEPLTGRSAEFNLYPLSVNEVSSNGPEVFGHSRVLMLRGGYPGLWQLPNEEAEERLRNIAFNYLYRDAFSPLVIYDQTILNNLLRLLAYQIGNEVNYTEIGRKLGIASDTAQRYVDLLEKAFIVFRLNQFRKNRRSEVGRLRKVYFYDLGIRNALIDNFSPLEMRDDAGVLWENFCIVERIKYISSTNRHLQYFYWRNKNQREIDLIEEEQNNIMAYEFKLGNKRPILPSEFRDFYPEAQYKIVNPINFPPILFGNDAPEQTRLLP